LESENDGNQSPKRKDQLWVPIEKFQPYENGNAILEEKLSSSARIK